MQNSKIPTGVTIKPTRSRVEDTLLYAELLEVVYSHMDDLFTIEDMEGIAKHVAALTKITGRL